MGQYYTILNIDKKQKLEPHYFDNGSKLMEWGYNGNLLVRALMNLLAEEWQGDRVYVVGDYADSGDTNECWEEQYKAVIDEFEIDEEKESLISYADSHFKDYSSLADIKERDWRYIVNRATGQYIDLEHCPVEWTYYNSEEDEGGTVSISSLVILLAMGNGRGGGDYRPMNQDKINDLQKVVGSWCKDVRELEILEDGSDLEDGLAEYRPDFTEREQVVPYMEKDKEIAECVKKGREAAAKKAAM